MHAVHAQFQCITRPPSTWVCGWHHLEHACWAGGQLVGQPAKIFQERMAMAARSHTLPSLSLWQMASCKEQKRPRAPGMANAMDRSSPITCCHFLVEVCLWYGVMLSNMACSYATRRGGNWMVLVVVSSTNPSNTLRVDQVALPFNSFFNGSRFLAEWAIGAAESANYLIQAM
jgi:hypothetical protein